MQSVSSNAVAQQLQIGGFIKETTVTLEPRANTYTTSGSGLLYKDIVYIPDVIGSGHTVISIFVNNWNSTNNYPWGIYKESAGHIGVWTTNQAFRGNIEVKIIYI